MKQSHRNHKLYNIWDKVPVTYYQKGISKNLFQWLWHSQKISLSKKIIGKVNFRNCLDVGCASGYMTNELKKAFPKASFYGIDVYDKVVEHAKKTYPDISFEVASAEKLSFKNNQFDLITFYETIEHVEDPKACLRELKRVLSNDGTLIITMDSGNLLFRTVWFFWEKTKGKVWRGAHLHPFHHNRLEEIIKEAGFKLKKKIFSHLGMEVTFVVKK